MDTYYPNVSKNLLKAHCIASWRINRNNSFVIHPGSFPWKILVCPWQEGSLSLRNSLNSSVLRFFDELCTNPA